MDGEKRLLASEGLNILKTTENIGVSALLSAAGLDGKPVSSETVAFGIVPRINAAGRLGKTSKALELLLCEEEERAAELAREMNELNQHRQALGNEIAAQVQQQLNQYQLALAAAQEREKTLEEARTQIAGLVMAATAKVLSESGEAGQRLQLYDQYLAKAGVTDESNRNSLRPRAL